MPWPPREKYISTRFKDFDDLSYTLKNPDYLLSGVVNEILEALLFLAEEVQRLHAELESLNNEYRGYDP